MAEKRQDYALRGVWKKLYQDSTYKQWSSSVHRDAAQLKRIIDDIGYDRAKEVMEYYFHISKKPDFMYFVYNYDKLADAKDARDEDRRLSKSRREATRKRMKEWGIES